MKRMAILTLTPEDIIKLLQLPNGATLIELSIPFEEPGVMRIKIEGAGWEIPKGTVIPRTPPAQLTSNHLDGTYNIDWGLPEGESVEPI